MFFSQRGEGQERMLIIKPPWLLRIERLTTRSQERFSQSSMTVARSKGFHVIPVAASPSLVHTEQPLTAAPPPYLCPCKTPPTDGPSQSRQNSFLAPIQSGRNWPEGTELSALLLGLGPCSCTGPMLTQDLCWVKCSVVAILKFLSLDLCL